MGQRILDLSMLQHDPACELAGLAILRCASTRGWRCGHPLCPQCARRIAEKNRQWVEQRMVAARGKLVHITLTAPADQINVGHDVLFSAFRQLRRRAAWTAPVVGGYAHGEVVESIGARRWNVHLHILCELRGPLDPSALRTAWSELLAVYEAVGRLSCMTADRRFVESRNGGLIGLAALYVTKRRRGRDWLPTSDEGLRELVHHFGVRRWARRFGSWTARSNARRQRVDIGPQIVAAADVTERSD